MRIRSALTLTAVTAGIISASTGVASASPTSSDAAPNVTIMVVKTAFCGTTSDGNGWFRVNVGDWGSMEYMPSNYSLDTSKLKKGEYVEVTIDPDRFRAYDIQADPDPAFDMHPCTRIGA